MELTFLFFISGIMSLLKAEDLSETVEVYVVATISSEEKLRGKGLIT
jgi:hypothetical protein